MSELVQEILAGCRRGDVSAQEKLYHMFADRMWMVCRRYAPNIEQARDILQEGFIVIFEKIHQYRGNGSFEGWMRRIFINLALAEYRKKRLVYCEISDLLFHSPKEPEVEEEAYEFSEKELLEMITSLPPQYRMVFNLYAFEEMSHKDIAQLLGISEGTSKSNLFRAREWLKKKIEEKKAGVQRVLNMKL